MLMVKQSKLKFKIIIIIIKIIKSMPNFEQDFIVGHFISITVQDKIMIFKFKNFQIFYRLYFRPNKYWCLHR